MDCIECSEELTALLDGELSRADSERVRSHLKTCMTCSEELRSLRETGDFVESHNRTLEPRAESWNMLRSNIGQAIPAPAPRGWGFDWRFALAAAGLLIAFAIGYMQYMQVQQRSLDQYISRYVREREVREINSRQDNPYMYNPFIEVKAALKENPFRSEDR